MNTIANHLVEMGEGQHMMFYHGENHDGPSIRKTHSQAPSLFMVEYYENGGYQQYPTSQVNDAINKAIAVVGPGPQNISIDRNNPPSSTLIMSELQYQIVPI